VHAGARRANRVLGVHRIGQRDVHRINLFEAGVVLIVGVRPVDAVLLPDHLALTRVTADESRQTRISCVRERRKNGDLRDMAETDHAVADGTSTPYPGHELFSLFSVPRCLLCIADLMSLVSDLPHVAMVTLTILHCKPRAEFAKRRELFAEIQFSSRRRASGRRCRGASAPAATENIRAARLVCMRSA
jgi:hypothetical protein